MRLFHGCSDKKSQWRKQNEVVTVAKTVITTDYLATWRKQKITVELWELGGAILQPNLLGGGGGGGSLSFARFLFFLLCIWMNENF